MTFPKASHFYIADDHWLGIVYEDVSPEELQESLAALQRISNVDAQLAENGDSTIFVGIKKTDGFKDTIRAVREVAQAKLPLLVVKLKLEFNMCRRGLHSTAAAFPSFVPGFEPDDPQLFMNAFYVKASEVTISNYVTIDGSKELYPLLVDIFHALLKILKVNVQEIDLSVSFCC